MKVKFLSSLFLVGALTASAQGYKDGVEYYNVGDLTEAQEILNRTLKDPTTNQAEAYYYLGQIAFKNGNTTAAKDYFNKGIQVNPEVAYNYVGLATIDLKDGNKDAAKDNIKLAEKYGKKDALVLVAIARAYAEADAVTYAKEVEKYKKNALKREENCPAVYILDADMFAKKGDQESIGQAAGYYDMAMEFDKADGKVNHPEANIKYARVYFTVNPKFAIDRIKALLENRSDLALAQRELGEKYYDNNQLTLAAEQYGKYIQNPNSFKKDRQRYVGLLYFGGKYQESLNLANQILSEDPGNIYMERMILLNKAIMKDWAGAEAAADKLFSNPKGEFVANDYSTYGDVLQELKKDSLAIEQYKKAIALAPEKAIYLKSLSEALYNAEKYQESADVMEKYVASPEASLTDKLTLARRYQALAQNTPLETPERGEIADKGIKIIDAIIPEAPSNCHLPYYRAILIYNKNNNKPTQEVADAFIKTIEVLDMTPENKTKYASYYVNSFNTIANFYLLQKDNAKAKEYFLKSLEVKENPDLRKIVEGL